MKNAMRSVPLSIACLVIACLHLSVLATPGAHEVTGWIADEAEAPVEGALIQVIDTTTGQIVASGRSGPDGSFTLLVESGAYDVYVIPPPDSGLTPDGEYREISGGQLLSFVLDPLPDPAPPPPPPKSAADSYEVFGRVTDQSGDPIPNTTVEVIDPATGGTVASTTTDPNGDYSLTVEAGTYDLRVTPPPASGLGPALVLNRTIDADTEIDVVLVPAGTVTLSGYVTNPSGEPIPNQPLQLAPEGTENWVLYSTDPDGYYYFETAPGDYRLRIIAYNPVGIPEAPRYYRLQSHSSSLLSLTTSTTMDIELPVRQVRVQVQDPGGAGVADVAVHSNYPHHDDLPFGAVAAWGQSGYPVWRPPAVTDASGETTLWLFPTWDPYYTYTFTAIPPAGSGFATTNVFDVTFDSDTTVVITLEAPVTLSGYVTNPSGEPIPNQPLQLAPEGTENWVLYSTDPDGYYYFETAPGDYRLRIIAYNPVGIPEAPRYYRLQSHSSSLLSLTTSTTMDIELPVRQVRVLVQDPGGAGVADVAVHSNYPHHDDLPFGAVAAWGQSGYPVWRPPAVTDASGETTLWLFPTWDPYYTYTFTAIPPAGTPFGTFNVSDVTVATDKSIVIVLQFLHPPPVTTATVLGAPSANGNYPDPTTVALSATATAGYSVSATYYRIDGGAEQTYSAPFAVSGPGPHTVSFWSIDDAGVYEITQHLSFDVNYPPVAVCQDVSVVVGAECSAAASIDAGSYDPDDDEILVSQDPAGPFGLGTFSVTLSVEDDLAASDSCTASVTTLDETAPLLTVDTTPITVTDADCSGDEPAVLPAASAVDNCDPDVLVGASSTGPFPAGETTTVVYTATDDSGNSSNAGVDVTVLWGADIAISAAKHTVGGGTYPGSTKQALPAIEVCGYDKSEGSCARVECGGISHQHYTCIAAGDGTNGPCAPVNCCTTDANGECTLNLPPGDYIVISDDATKTVLPDPLGVSASDLLCGELKQKHLQQIVRDDGKKMPGKTTRRTGSELLIIEPEFVEWDEQQEPYPVVFESVGEWNAGSSVTPPEGFVSDYDSLTEDVDDEVEAVQFVLTDIGSDWVPTETTHVLRHKGRREVVLSRIGVRLSAGLAKAKGLDRDGHPLGPDGDALPHQGFDPRGEWPVEIVGWIEPSAVDAGWTLNLQVNRASDLELAITRGQGAVVQLLASGSFVPGEYSFSWDSESLGPGRYFLRLASGGLVQKLKLVEY